jgi:hypothetical protein
VPLAVRLVNAAVFPVVAAYLQVVGLRLNAQRRKRQAAEGQFRTHTSRRRLAFVSERFDRLRADLAPATHVSRDDPGMAAPSRIPSAR